MKFISENNRDLIQILLNIIVIGIFSIVENWLLFYYPGTWHMPVIFGVLSVLMYCVLAINVYNCLKEMQSRSSDEEAKKEQALLYQKLLEMENELQELKKNQLRSTKLLLKKEEELREHLQ